MRLSLSLTTLFACTTMVTAVEAPSALTADPTDTGGISLSWIDHASDETGYTIERCRDNVHYEAVATVGANTESWTDTTVEAGLLYCYRVHPTGEPDRRSNWNYAVVHDAVSADLTVAYCDYRENPDGSVTIIWNDHFSDETAFVIRRSDNFGDPIEVHVAPANTTSWTDSTVSGGLLQYLVIPRKGAVDATWENSGFVYLGTGSASITTPTGLTATVAETARIQLDWSTVAEATAYLVEVSRDGGLTYKTLAQDLTATTFNHHGVQRDMLYHYRVRSVTDAGMSRPSAPVTATATIRDDLPAPSELIVIEDTGGNTLTWRDRASNESGYAVEREDDDGWTRVATLPANATTWFDSAGGRWDDYRVQALSASGDSGYSNIGGIRSTTTYTAATGLATAGKSKGRVELTWTKGEGYQEQAIERSTDGSSWETVGLVGSGTEIFTDFGLLPGVTYHYRITAWRRHLSSTSITYTRAAATGAPSKPSNVNATGVAEEQINLRWQDTSSHETGFIVQRNTGTGFTTIATLTANRTAFCDTDLDGIDSASYRVQATGTDGDSAWSSTASANTRGSDPNVTVTTRDHVDYIELIVTGTAANDAITIADDGAQLLVTANGSTTSHDRTVGVVTVNAGAGCDTVTVDTSVSTRTLLRGGADDDVLTALGSGRNTLVAVADGVDTLTGNGHDSSYWCDSADTVHASTREAHWNRIHVVDRCEQFWSTDPDSNLFIDAAPDGRRWNDTRDRPARGLLSEKFNHDLPLWGKGPTLFDVNQGLYQNCPLTGWYQCAVDQWPTRVQEAAVDLGDGTYLVQCGPADRQIYARVDGDVDSGWMANLGPQRQQWFLILEKVYTAFRMPAYQPPIPELAVSGSNSSFIDYQQSDDDLYNQIRTALDHRAIISVWTSGTPIDVPAVAQGHNHGIVEAYRDATGKPMVIVRNPYGVTKTNWDTGPLYRSLGLMRMSVAHLRANFFVTGNISSWSPPLRRIMLMVDQDGTPVAIDAVLDPGAINGTPDDDDQQHFRDLDIPVDYTISIDNQFGNNG